MEDPTRDIRIVTYRSALQRHFYELNVAWISKHFVIEPSDLLVLEDPEQEIIAKGGSVWFALANDQVVGTCALKPYADGEYELSKMSVVPGFQRRGIGERLIAAAIAQFEARGGKQLFLESSTKLEPALRLYTRMGFVLQAQLRSGSPYARSYIYMIYKGLR